MKKKLIRETDLFTRINILLTETQKDSLESIKNELSLMSNAEMDNSTLIRALIDYFSKKPEQLEKIVSYALNTKGYEIVAQFEKMILEGSTDEEIIEKLGLGIDVITTGREKLKKSI